jgi:FeoA domain
MRHDVEHPPHDAPDARDSARRDDGRPATSRHGETRHAGTRYGADHHGDVHHAEGPTVALAALGHGAIARVESVGGGSLAPLLERLGIRAGSVVRCQTCASSTIVLLVGSRLVPIPRAWAHAVLVTPFEPAPLADHTPSYRHHGRGPSSRSVAPPPGVGPSISREERSFVADASSRMLG